VWSRLSSDPDPRHTILCRFEINCFRDCNRSTLYGFAFLIREHTVHVN
jgi:hypothetical protein